MGKKLKVISGMDINKKLSEIDAIKAVGFDMQETVRDLFAILENLHTDMDKIKSALKAKNIM